MRIIKFEFIIKTQFLCLELDQTCLFFRMVLSTCSPYFRTLFSSVPHNQHPVIFVKDIEVDDVNYRPQQEKYHTLTLQYQMGMSDS